MIRDLLNCCKTSCWKHRIFVFSIFASKSFENFLENLSGYSTFSSSPNASPRSAINFTTETKRCRQRQFPILFALIDLTGWFCINSSQWLITSATKCIRGINMFHWMFVAPQALNSVLPVEDSFSTKQARNQLGTPGGGWQRV